MIVQRTLLSLATVVALGGTAALGMDLTLRAQEQRIAANDAAIARARAALARLPTHASLVDERERAGEDLAAFGRIEKMRRFELDHMLAMRSAASRAGVDVQRWSTHGDAFEVELLADDARGLSDFFRALRAEGFTDITMCLRLDHCPEIAARAEVWEALHRSYALLSGKMPPLEATPDVIDPARLPR